MTNKTIALAGNPNIGKTVLFNALTGSTQRTGNWPGVTVSKKSGELVLDRETYKVVDLPGVYTLTVADLNTAIDERIACEFLIEKQADVIVNVVDASNLERNLYLTLQLLEMSQPVIVALNMMDAAEHAGIHIDVDALAKQLGCPVVPIIATRKKGLDELTNEVLITAPKASEPNYRLPEAIQPYQQHLEKILHRHTQAHWLAHRLLEDDAFAKNELNDEEKTQVDNVLNELSNTLKDDADILIADARYQLARQIVDDCTRLKRSTRRKTTAMIDKIVLNRWLGIPIFLLIMYCMFVFAINFGGAFQDFFDIGSTTIFVDGLAHVMHVWGVPTWLIAILADGLGKGINTVITFTPIIGGMFLFLSFLEDSGYMARASFVVDRLMQMLGLPGKSFVPMIVGFGCNVPAVMSARTLENPRDRILTVMMSPFMSCGARLAIFAVFVSAFFPAGGQDVIFALYVIGIIVAILTAFILRKTILPGESAPMVMELPNYHWPTIGSVCRHTWSRLKRFLFRAGKVIIPVCIFIGVFNTINWHGQIVGTAEFGGSQSILSSVGRTVTPVLAPMGIKDDNWPATVGLASGVLAKEVVVGTLNTLYSQAGGLTLKQDKYSFWEGLDNAWHSISDNFSDVGSWFANPVLASESEYVFNDKVYGVMVKYFDGKAGAFAYLLFVLLYFPCISTMAAMKRELNSRWATFSVVWSTGMAYSISVLAYQALTFTRHPSSSASWIGSIFVLYALVVWRLRKIALSPNNKLNTQL